MLKLFCVDWFKRLQQTGLFWVFLFVFLLSACETFPSMDYILVFSESVEQIDDSTAKFSAHIENRSEYKIIESGFYWGFMPNEKELKLVFENEISGLLTLKTDQPLIKGRSIYVRAFAKTNTFEVIGRELMVKVKGEANKGFFKELQGRGLGGGWCHPINLGFQANGGYYFVLENGDILFYDFISNTYSFVQNSQELKVMDVAFRVEGEEYFFSKNRFYRLNVDDFSLIPLKTWGTQDMVNVTGFAIGKEIFIGMGIPASNTLDFPNSFWKYSIDSDSWMQVENFPGKGRYYAEGFTLNGFGAVSGGYGLHRSNDMQSFGFFPDFWQYDPTLNKWTEKRSLSSIPNDFSYTAVSHMDVAYFFINSTLYEYYSAFNIWESMATTGPDCSQYLFSYQDNLYLAKVHFDSNENVLTLLQYEK
jgi:hypothetical protein